MPITKLQREKAEASQIAAAHDKSSQIRLVAGPGTGKSHTIEARVAKLLDDGIAPEGIFVISFTRAACSELAERIVKYCSTLSCAENAKKVNVSTMHSLALRILRKAGLLISYPSTPIMIDDWEQAKVYDTELAATIGCAPKRAREIRLAHDAKWQTLSPDSIAQAKVTKKEIESFNKYHSSRTNLYSCVLPGEVIYKCVQAFSDENLTVEEIPRIEHLIVDEYQDLNACDQEFIRLLTENDTKLFIAGDDDQSIYSFRHANPDGIVNFNVAYPDSSLHILNDCFRCTPNILEPALKMIAHNPDRIDKKSVPLYKKANPPVHGTLHAWSFKTSKEEAVALASSCKALIDNGMAGHENEILILVSNRKVLLDDIMRELTSHGIDFELPRGINMIDKPAIRAVYTFLRIAKEQIEGNDDDYLAHRDLLELLTGVGPATSKLLGDACIKNNQNFRDLFYLDDFPSWLTGRIASAVQRASEIISTIDEWDISSTLEKMSSDILDLLKLTLGSKKSSDDDIKEWSSLEDDLPETMTLEELLVFLTLDNEAAQQEMLAAIWERDGRELGELEEVSKKIRILTMHGAKGLSGKIVFIPGMAQGLMPNGKSIKATGLLIEQRRLFYVSLTRAMACCIVSHAKKASSAQSMVLGVHPRAILKRSMFLGEMDVRSIARDSGLTKSEAKSIINDVSNLY